MADEHTPGPWGFHRLEGSAHVRRVFAGTRPMPLAIVEPIPTKYQAQESIEANARLIAAAPELLEALEWYEAQVSDCDRDGFEGDAARSGLAKDSGKMARAAIAKARGQRDG